MVTELAPYGADGACFAPAGGLLRPCVVSRSRRRSIRLRDRRIAVRRSQQQSLTRRGALTERQYSFSRSPSIKHKAVELVQWPTETVVNRDAAPFVPTDAFAFSAVRDEREEVLLTYNPMVLELMNQRSDMLCRHCSTARLTRASRDVESCMKAVLHQHNLDHPPRWYHPPKSSPRPSPSLRGLAAPQTPLLSQGPRPLEPPTELRRS